MLSDGRRVWQHVAGLVADWGATLLGERGLSSVGAVVGATVPRAVAEARRLLPQSVLLLPGVGAQGATARRRRPSLYERARPARSSPPRAPSSTPTGAAGTTGGRPPAGRRTLRAEVWSVSGW